MRWNFAILLAGVLTMSTCAANTPASAAESQEAMTEADASAFLTQHCVACHGDEKPKSNFRVDDLLGEAFDPADVKRWQKILEMVDIGEMPPAGRPQPSDNEREAFESAVNRLLVSVNASRTDGERELPRYGNRVDHDALFSGEHWGPAYTPARVWRINGNIYSQLMQDLDLGRDFVVPLRSNEEGFNDYARLYADEATIRTMMQNAKRVADAIIHGRLITPAGAATREKDNKPYRTGGRHEPINDFIAIEGKPARSQLDAVAAFVFEMLLLREPTTEELDRYVTGVLAPNIAAGGNEAGLHGYIVALLLSPEFLFRGELGLGQQLPDGRRMLSPNELAYALSFTLHDHPVESLLLAAEQGQLNTRADVERAFRALYDDPNLLRGRMAVGSRDRVWQASKPFDTPAKPRLLRFFQEYFDYEKAPDVFKDETRHGGQHSPQELIKDADWTVLHILAEDRHVLEELLTTDRFAVPAGKKSKKKPKPGEENKPRMAGYLEAYNLTKAPENDRGFVRTAMPEGQRAGLLTHPAWLVAHSQNFHTDPVRRGKWIQEHLLGYPVPELPIAVQAQLPEEPHHTIRERFRVVRAEGCWRCHKKMNPLGEPFEAYDDFGRYRELHLVGTDGNIVEAAFEKTSRFSPQHVKNAELKIPVNTTGELVGTGDPELDGPVNGPVDLMSRLAKSERVRQVFIRHIFRFWMGRNETLNDSPTLMAMDKAYVATGGSLKETLVALVTSDSFLYRK